MQSRLERGTDPSLRLQPALVRWGSASGLNPPTRVSQPSRRICRMGWACSVLSSTSGSRPPCAGSRPSVSISTPSGCLLLTLAIAWWRIQYNTGFSDDDSIRAWHEWQFACFQFLRCLLSQNGYSVLQGRWSRLREDGCKPTS